MNAATPLLDYSFEALYAALLRKDPAYEGMAFVGVKTTGIFCRLTCSAKKPYAHNVDFYRTTKQAQTAGFRACKRCRPESLSAALPEWMAGLIADLKAAPEDKWSAYYLSQKGLNVQTVRRAFLKHFGVSFAQYARALRLGAGLSQLEKGASVIEAQLEAGYDSGSGFREAINALLGAAPQTLKTKAVLSAKWLTSPLGPMLAIAGEDGVYLLEFIDRRALPTEISRLHKQGFVTAFRDHPMLDRLEAELAAYYAGTLKNFTTPVVQFGTEFQKSVWKALCDIPYGQTVSYGEQAVMVGKPTAQRAVATGNGANPLAVIIPCHRVIGADGSLTGYGGKVWRKQWLLEHERKNIDSSINPTDAGICVVAEPPRNAHVG